MQYIFVCRCRQSSGISPVPPVHPAGADVFSDGVTTVMIPEEDADSVRISLLDLDDLLEIIYGVLEIIKPEIPFGGIRVGKVPQKDNMNIFIIQRLIYRIFPEVSAVDVRNYQNSFHMLSIRLL